MAIDYYRERDTGDYIAVIPGTARVQRLYPNNPRLLDTDTFYDVRAAALAGQPSSVQTCTATSHYLKKECRRVRRENVPERWRKAIGLEEAADAHAS